MKPLASLRAGDLRARAEAAGPQLHIQRHKRRHGVTDPQFQLCNAWRRKGALARWRFSLPRSASTKPRDALLGCLVSAVRALEGFARPTEASWTSAAAGEDALEQDLGHAPEATLLASPLTDPTEVVLSLALFYADPASGENEIGRAGDLWVELDPGDAQITIRLTLDVDFYAWRAWGRDRDNRATAELNAPRLRSFLVRLQRDMGASIEDIDAPDYPGQVDGLGFSSSGVSIWRPAV